MKRKRNEFKLICCLRDSFAKKIHSDECIMNWISIFDEKKQTKNHKQRGVACSLKTQKTLNKKANICWEFLDWDRSQLLLCTTCVNFIFQRRHYSRFHTIIRDLKISINNFSNNKSFILTRFHRFTLQNCYFFRLTMNMMGKYRYCRK